MSLDEKLCISGYRDGGYEQFKWDYPIPKKYSSEKDSYMINNFLRGYLIKEDVNEKDYKHLIFMIKNLDSATRSYQIRNTFTIFKGIDDDSWIDVKFDEFGFPLNRKNNVFTDFGFGSFTSDLSKAGFFSKRGRSDNNLIIMVRNLRFGETAVYVDDDEFEWLLPQGLGYIFERKMVQPSKNNSKVTWYFIRRII